ncbi:putative bir1 protein [Plasmodium yoelii yoelii]|uniref:Bir1 protein n=1 Tax=Plasmodium yoelii yoelii TaxID=73239 RepID=Q7RA91_PLAYO|nr:putative bir1 protein [Plasmodium yoelii yoelii]
MLTSKVCKEFDTFWKIFPDDLTKSGEYDFKVEALNNYCPKKICEGDINKIHAGCLWLFNKFYGNSNNFSSNANGNMNIVTYIMTWISYKLNQKKQDGITTFNDFYSKHMQNVEEYKNNIYGVTGYQNYIDLINKKEKLMDIDISDMSKFYSLFKKSCNMFNNAGKQGVGKTHFEYTKEFVAEHQKLNNNIGTEDSSYSKIFSTLSSDYSVLQKSDVIGTSLNFPSLSTEKTAENVVASNYKETKIVFSSETVESSSKTKVSYSDIISPILSLLNKLIPIPLIFVAALILLGIAYKVNNNSIKKYIQN